MSKHKHFHSANSGARMLQYARRELIGPFCKPSSTRVPGKKKTAADAANIDGGEAEQVSSKLNDSSPILGADKGDCQDENQ